MNVLLKGMLLAPLITMSWALQVLILLLHLIFRMICWICRKVFTKRIPRLPTGEKIIVYADGKELVELKHDNGPTRLVPNTPALRARLAQRKPQGAFKRFMNVLKD